MTSKEFFASLPSRKREYEKYTSDESRIAALEIMIADMDELNLSDTTYWQVMHDFLGDNYVDELDRLGILEEEDVLELELEDEVHEEDEDEDDHIRWANEQHKQDWED